MTLVSSKPRDQRLDIAKGIAIILVVIGHTLQTRFANFDEVWGFRIIYSFHMPLFVFLSGTVASLWFKPIKIELAPKTLCKILGVRIRNAFIRLVIPFISWAVVANVLSTAEINPFAAVITAFRRPDSGLWFLLCIFYCVVLMSLFQATLSLLFSIKQCYGFQNTLTKALLDGRLQLILIGFAWLTIRQYSPPGAGLGTLKTYFLFYILGIAFYRYLNPAIPASWRLAAYPLFIPLAYFWSRITPNNLVVELSGWPLAWALEYCFAPVIALSGIVLTWDVVCRLSEKNLELIKKCLAFLGRLSLGIYALHTYFMEINPPVIMPLILSVVISLILLNFKISKLIFLGEK